MACDQKPRLSGGGCSSSSFYKLFLAVTLLLSLPLFDALPQGYGGTSSSGGYAKVHNGAGGYSTKPVRKLPLPFVFNPIVPATVSNQPVLAVSETGVPVAAIPPEVITNADVIIANSQSAIAAQTAIITQATADVAEGLITQAQATATIANSQTLIQFIRLAVANAEVTLARQSARLTALAAAISTQPAGIEIRVLVPRIPATSLSNAATIQATAQTLIDAQVAIVVQADANVAAGIITQAEADAIRSNVENLTLFFNVIESNAQGITEFEAVWAAAEAAAAAANTKLHPGKAHDHGGLLGELLASLLGHVPLVKVKDSNVLNNLGSKLGTNAQVLSSGADITNTGGTGGVSLLKPILGGILGRAHGDDDSRLDGQSDTNRAQMRPSFTGISSADANNDLVHRQQSQLDHLIQLNNQLEALIHYFQQHGPVQHSFPQQNPTLFQHTKNQPQTGPAAYFIPHQFHGPYKQPSSYPILPTSIQNQYPNNYVNFPGEHETRYF